MSKHAETCHHVKTNGAICQAVALRNDRFCYFHRAARERQQRLLRNYRSELPFVLPVLEDRESIQMAIHEVMNALLIGRIDTKKAGLLLYALQIATKNARDLDFEAETADEVAEEYDPTEQQQLDAQIAEVYEENSLAGCLRRLRREEVAASLPEKKPSRHDPSPQLDTKARP